MLIANLADVKYREVGDAAISFAFNNWWLSPPPVTCLQGIYYNLVLRPLSWGFLLDFVMVLCKFGFTTPNDGDVTV